MPWLHESDPFQGSYGQPRETTQHLLGPIWATFGLLIQISLRSSKILYFLADRLNCAKFPSLKYAHISLWLNFTGYSKFHNTSNHILPATDSGRTARTTLNPPVQAVPPSSLFFPCSEQAKASTCAHDSMHYNSLLWMCTLNTLTSPDH